MKLSLFALGAAFAASVSAQTAPVDITWPVAPQGTTVPAVAGCTFHITWDTVGITNPGPTVNLYLMNGPSNALAPVQNLSTVTTSTGSYDWEIPAQLKPSDQYAIRFGNSPNFAYSGYINVSANTGSCNAPSSSGNTSGSPSTGSVSPGASGSSASNGSAPSNSGSASPSSTTTSGTTPTGKPNAATKAAPAVFGVLAAAAVAAVL